MQEENQSGEVVDTTATNTNDTGVEVVSKEQAEASIGENDGNTNAEKSVRVFTEEEVRQIMQKRVNRSHKRYYDRYGVENLEQLDEKFNSIETLTNEKKELSAKYDELSNSHKELVQKMAFIENGIDPEKKDDILAYFKGKGIDLDDANLKSELEKHPEWKKTVENKSITIREMSPSRSTTTETDEAEEVAKMFGLSKIYNFNRR